MKLMIFGPPGSGKGTYSQRIAARLGIAKISTGDIFRDMAKQDTELGRKVKDTISKGILIPDDLTTEILKERMSKDDAKKGFILDGYPRTIPQAESLEKLTEIDAIISIIAPEEILVEKISARRICSNTKCDGNFNVADIRKTIDGIEYILPPLMPKSDMTCDKCGGKLYQRSDDMPDVIKDRLAVYEKQSKPVIEHYKTQGRIPFVNVHMNRPPEVIVENILGQLGKLGLE